MATVPYGGYITSACELRRLGGDAEIHEQIRLKIDGAKKMSLLRHNGLEFLIELVRIRNLHGLPSDGSCYQCDGSKCP